MWNFSVFIFLWLEYVIQHSVLKVYPCLAYHRISFLLSIPLYVYLHFLYLFILPWTLGYFCILVTMSNIAINMYKYILHILFSIMLVIYPEVGFLDHIVILFFSYLRNFPTAFHRSCPILRSHQHRTRVLISPHRHQNLIFSGIHHREYEVIYHCGFDD